MMNTEFDERCRRAKRDAAVHHGAFLVVATHLGYEATSKLAESVSDEDEELYWPGGTRCIPPGDGQVMEVAGMVADMVLGTPDADVSACCMHVKESLADEDLELMSDEELNAAVERAHDVLTQHAPILKWAATTLFNEGMITSETAKQFYETGGCD